MDSLSEWLLFWQADFAAGNRPTEIKGPYPSQSVYSVTFHEDSDWDEDMGDDVYERCATIQYALPEGVFVESALGEDTMTYFRGYF